MRCDIDARMYILSVIQTLACVLQAQRNRDVVLPVNLLVLTTNAVPAQPGKAPPYFNLSKGEQQRNMLLP